MATDTQQKLDLANNRVARLKKAKQQAEDLLEQKSRELYQVNQTLAEAKQHLQLDVQQAMHELSITNQRLQKSLEEKSSFIGSVSHEVRTPLNAIIGLSELMLTTQLDNTQQDYATTINNGAKSLMVLIDDILSITKIEAGRVNLNPTVIDPAQTIRNILGMFQLKAKQQGINLKLRLSKQLPNYIKIDEGRYSQIINNLITNALRHTDEGSITIELHYKAHDIAEDVGQFTTKVIDTGEGIKPEDMKRIFNTYEQIGNPNQGVGLGLAICQQLSELMMGRITCNSEFGVGTTFIATLPATEPAAEAMPKQTETPVEDLKKPLPNLKILLAEDNPINQKVVRAQLTQLGQTDIEIVDNGALALEKLANNDYDLIVLDILMPVMDGEQTIQHIRQANKDVSQHYCIALTASTYLDQRERLLKLGFDDFLSKPVTLQELHNALHKVPTQASISIPSSFAVTDETVTLNEKETNFNFLKTQFGDAYKAIFKEIAPSFLQHSYQELEQLKSAISNQQGHKTTKLSHSIKGAAGSMGFSTLSEVLQRIESDPLHASVHDWLEEVESKMKNLKPIIESELAAQDATNAD